MKSSGSDRSIVIVNWNSGVLLGRCVRSLLADSHDEEIVLVDNASEDSSLAFVLQIIPSLTVLQNEKNLGFASGCNRGWRHSKGKLVLFLNPDTESKPGAVGRLANALSSDPSIWAVGGKLLTFSGKLQVGFNVRSFPSLASVAADLLLLDELWPGNPWSSRYRMSGWDHVSTKDVDQPAASCLMVRREALELLNGFDEDFHPAWFEDVDLCRRLRNHGGRILFEPSAEFFHHGGTSLQHLRYEEFLRYFHTNMIRYFRKHHGESAANRVRRLVVCGMYLRSLVSWARPRVPGSRQAASPSEFRVAARHFTSHWRGAL